MLIGMCILVVGETKHFWRVNSLFQGVVGPLLVQNDGLFGPNLTWAGPSELS